MLLQLYKIYKINGSNLKALSFLQDCQRKERRQCNHGNKDILLPVYLLQMRMNPSPRTHPDHHHRAPRSLCSLNSFRSLGLVPQILVMACLSAVWSARHFRFCLSNSSTYSKYSLTYASRAFR
ncbi:hypothetical protein BDV41DRAFT_542900 [Aspergillus transmontanensis]|uniref:Uncharacterized protein n=1 Tax=Aspergillus transmontanensis TaxID=1034304 RepID=A0A5N6VQZ5_9EURO|nr:hypothetical protein BDV41DRAFT_542900 [Aspergillus transmontanensis]